MLTFAAALAKGFKEFPALVVIDTEEKKGRTVSKAVLEHGAHITPVKGSKLPDNVLRTEASKTGDPLIDRVIDGPITSRNINRPTVDRTYDVPYGSGGSDPLEDPTTYLDRHVPRTMTVGSVTFDPAEPFLVHENVEQKVMELLINSGWEDEEAYRVAHFEFAERAEGAWYEAHGIDRAEVEAMEKPWLDQIQHDEPAHPPPNLYDKPYPHSDVTLAQGEPIAEAAPSDDEVRRGRAAVAAAIGLPFELVKAGQYDESQHPRDDHGKWTSGGGSSDQLTGPQAAGLRDIALGAKLDDAVGDLEAAHESLDSAANDANSAADNADQHEREEGEPDPDLESDAVSAQKDAVAAALEVHQHLRAIAERSAAALKAYEARLASHGIGSFRKLENDMAKINALDPRVRNVLSKADKSALEALELIMSGLAKSQPTASDVHAPSSGDRKGKKKSFKDLLAERKAKATTPVGKADENDWSIDMVVTKAEEVGDQRLVFGFASMSELDGKLVVDKQNDIIEPEELEKAAYEFVQFCRSQGDMHERMGVGTMVESMVFTKQKQELLGIDLGLQGWWVGFRVSDEDVWKRIKRGELPEFSIGGRAVRVPTE